VTTVPAVPIDEQTGLKFYRMMVEARVLAQRVYDLFMQGLVTGTSHLAIGQEAIAADSADAVARATETLNESRTLPNYARADALAHVSQRLTERHDELAEPIAREGLRHVMEEITEPRILIFSDVQL
jgi:acyl-CoA reductase-like NAD-dependent aldehyde dehydrogenase